MTYSPFEVSRAIGTNISKQFQKQRESSAIEEILANAMQTDDPAVLQQSIGQMLSKVSPERQGPAIKLLQGMVQNIQKKQQKQQQGEAYKQYGLEGAQNLLPAVQAQIFKNQANQTQYENIFGKNQAAQPQQQAVPQQQQEMPQDATQNIKNATEDQLIKGLSIPTLRPVFQAELDRRFQDKSLSQKKDLSKVERDAKRAGEVLKRADELANSVPVKQAALNQMNDAIAKKNLGFFSLDNLADLTGVEAFRTPEGAQFKTAVKEYFLSNLSRIKGRPNQWIEQQILDATSKIGRTTASNLITDRALQNEIDLENKYIDLANSIYKEEEERTGSPPGDLAARVNKKLSSYALDKETEMFNDFRAIRSIEDKKHDPFKNVKKGTVVSDIMIQALLNRFGNDPRKAEKEAEKLGYSLE